MAQTPPVNNQQLLPVERRGALIANPAKTPNGSAYSSSVFHAYIAEDNGGKFDPAVFDLSAGVLGWNAVLFTSDALSLIQAKSYSLNYGPTPSVIEDANNLGNYFGTITFQQPSIVPVNGTLIARTSSDEGVGEQQTYTISNGTGGSITGVRGYGVFYPFPTGSDTPGSHIPGLAPSLIDVVSEVTAIGQSGVISGYALQNSAGGRTTPPIALIPVIIPASSLTQAIIDNGLVVDDGASRYVVHGVWEAASP